MAMMQTNQRPTYGQRPQAQVPQQQPSQVFNPWQPAPVQGPAQGGWGVPQRPVPQGPVAKPTMQPQPIGAVLPMGPTMPGGPTAQGGPAAPTIDPGMLQAIMAQIQQRRQAQLGGPAGIPTQATLPGVAGLPPGVRMEQTPPWLLGPNPANPGGTPWGTQGGWQI